MMMLASREQRRVELRESKNNGGRNERKTHLGFPLPQHCRCRRRGRHPPARRPVSALRRLNVAACMVHSATDPDGVHPDPLLRLVVPDRLEPLLAYWTCGVGHGWVVGYRDVLFLCCLKPYRVWRPVLGVSAGGSFRGFCGAGFVDVVSRFDPFLEWFLGHARCTSDMGRLTTRSTYQLLCCPRFVASTILMLTLKCQSRCRAFFFLPSSVARNRRPQVVH